MAFDNKVSGSRKAGSLVNQNCSPGRVKQSLRSGTAVNRQGGSRGTSLVAALKRNWWMVGLFVMACCVAAFFVSKQIVPLYEATAVVEVDYQQASGVIGQDAIRPMPSTDTDEFLGTQVKLVTSDNVLRPVVNKYKLLELEKQINGKDAAADAAVRRAPVVLKRLHVNRQTSTQLLQISYRSPSPELSAQVVNEIADTYVNRIFDLRSKTSASLGHFMENHLAEIKVKMDVSNATLSQFEREMGMINPEQRTSVLSARLLQLSTEYTTAQGERMRKEAAAQASKTSGMQAAQLSSEGAILSKIDEKRVAARQNFASVASNLGRNHPDYRKARAEADELDRQFEEMRKSIDTRLGTDYAESLTREKMLERQIKESKAEYDAANRHLFAYEQLKRDANDDRTMYAELLRKVRESSINAGFPNRTVRVVDEARPAAKPVSPNTPVNVVLAGISSLLLGTGGLFAFSAMDDKLRGERQTGERLQVQVLGSLPMVSRLGSVSLSERQESFGLVETGSGAGAKMHLVAYEESVRKLRNTVDVAAVSGGVRSLLITSAMPGEGKSMTAGDLALAFARQYKRTLLIDADLRCPVQHGRFGLANTVGLADVLSGTSYTDSAIQPCDSVPNLFVLTSGATDRAPADLVGPSFGTLLNQLRDEFDLVIVDAPPMLAFAEPIQIAACVDAVVLVAKSGRTTAEAAQSVLATLQWAGARVLGVILSQVANDDESVSYQRQAYKYRCDTRTSSGPSELFDRG